MHRYIISIGSNLPTGAEEVEKAISWLETSLGIISATPTYTTPDAFHPDGAPYNNALAIVTTDIESDLLTQLFKEYEKRRGRKPGCKEIPVDLDPVCRDNEILRPRDYSAPYFLEGLYLLSKSGKKSRKNG